jgi:hypothetical protein
MSFPNYALQRYSVNKNTVLQLRFQGTTFHNSKTAFLYATAIRSERGGGRSLGTPPTSDAFSPSPHHTPKNKVPLTSPTTFSSVSSSNTTYVFLDLSLLDIQELILTRQIFRHSLLLHTSRTASSK